VLVERRGVIQFLMKPKILSWIVKGLNEGDKCLRVRNLLRDWKVAVVCFQETKLQVTSRSVVCSLWGFHHVD
jgi:exonuclease III